MLNPSPRRGEARLCMDVTADERAPVIFFEM